MRKAAIVFLRIGQFLQFYLVFPIIIGQKTINRLNKCRNVKDLKGWGIASIILVSVLGGIFTLCVRQEELDRIHGRLPHPKQVAEKEASLDYINNIKELKELLDNGAITQAEFDKLKAEQLNLNN